MSVMSVLLRCRRFIRREMTIEGWRGQIDYLAGYGFESRTPFRWNRNGVLVFFSDAFSSREPVPTSLENALSLIGGPALENRHVLVGPCAVARHGAGAQPQQDL